MTKTKHYGIYKLTLHEEDKRAVITRKRGRDPLPDNVLQKIKSWLLTDLSAYVFEGYSVSDETRQETK